MIHLEKVTYKNEEDVIALDIFESQYPFVADNAQSLADAYAAITSDDAHAYPFAIYDDDTPVGFLMLGYNEAALEGPDAPASLRNNYSLWRLMIDKRYQKKGFGREAVRLALEFVRTWPHGKADAKAKGYAAVEGYPAISDQRNDFDFQGPLALYQKAGFTETAREKGQAVMRKIL